MEPLNDSRRRWVRDPDWWRQFIARRKRSRFGWVRHWWTLVGCAIGGPWSTRRSRGPMPSESIEPLNDSRHVLALTNSDTTADLIERHAREDFTTIERHLRIVTGYGWCHEVSVSADEYERVMNHE